MGQSILILLLLLAAFYVFRYVVPGRRESALERQNATWTNGNGNPYKAVSIHSYGDVCAAAQQVAGQRFLTDEAPLIPLEDCTAEKCHCVYRHHSDRRRGGDRRGHRDTAEEFLATPGYQNRRNTRGRRAGDLAAA